MGTEIQKIAPLSFPENKRERVTDDLEVIEVRVFQGFVLPCQY